MIWLRSRGLGRRRTASVSASAIVSLTFGSDELEKPSSFVTSSTVKATVPSFSPLSEPFSGS